MVHKINKQTNKGHKHEYSNVGQIWKSKVKKKKSNYNKK